MKSYTFASPEACDAVKAELRVCIERSGEGFPLCLNETDAVSLVDALELAFSEGDEWAGDFLSCLAAAVGVEFV